MGLLASPRPARHAGPHAVGVPRVTHCGRAAWPTAGTHARPWPPAPAPEGGAAAVAASARRPQIFRGSRLRRAPPGGPCRSRASRVMDRRTDAGMRMGAVKGGGLGGGGRGGLPRICRVDAARRCLVWGGSPAAFCIAPVYFRLHPGLLRCPRMLAPDSFLACAPGPRSLLPSILRAVSPSRWAAAAARVRLNGPGRLGHCHGHLAFLCLRRRSRWWDRMRAGRTDGWLMTRPRAAARRAERTASVAGLLVMTLC